MKKMMFNCLIILVGAMFTIFFGCFKYLGNANHITYSNAINPLFYLSIAAMAAGFILCLDELSSSKKEK